MTYVRKTNHFFDKTVYTNIKKVAFSPVSWAFEGPLPIEKMLIAAVLWPILIPATVATIAISIALAAVSALAHGLSLLVAGAIDVFGSSQTPAPQL